jgi:hypothetical protein
MYKVERTKDETIDAPTKVERRQEGFYTRLTCIPFSDIVCIDVTPFSSLPLCDRP